jgi:hypothetical protein
VLFLLNAVVIYIVALLVFKLKKVTPVKAARPACVWRI